MCSTTDAQAQRQRTGKVGGRWDGSPITTTVSGAHAVFCGGPIANRMTDMKPATTRQPGKTGHYKSRLYVGKGWCPSRAHTKRDDAAKKPNWPKP